MTKLSVRIERDTFGPIEVPADRLWGAQTQRSLLHFRISTEKMPEALIRALLIVKRSAALVNTDLGLLPARIADAIEAGFVGSQRVPHPTSRTTSAIPGRSDAGRSHARCGPVLRNWRASPSRAMPMKCSPA